MRDDIAQFNHDETDTLTFDDFLRLQVEAEKVRKAEEDEYAL